MVDRYLSIIFGLDPCSEFWEIWLNGRTDKHDRWTPADGRPHDDSSSALQTDTPPPPPPKKPQQEITHTHTLDDLLDKNYDQIFLEYIPFEASSSNDPKLHSMPHYQKYAATVPGS